jgi:hypothetical protein
VTTESPLLRWGIDPTKAPPPVLASEEPIIRFFSYHDAHPIALTLVLMEKFGTDWIDWEPEVLKSEILLSFKANSVSEHNWQKIQAVRVLLKTVGFWREWGIFEKIIHALNNNVPRFDIAQRCTISQLMAGVDIVKSLRVELFDDEIQRYIVACAMDAGVTYLPPPLDFAQEILTRPMYKCNVCGSIDLDNMKDGRCDFCCGRFQHGHILSMKPSPHLPKTTGTNVERFNTCDPEPVKKRYDELRKKGWDDVTLNDSVSEDVQAAKLVVASDYVLKRKRELVEQLEELKSWVAQ